MLAPKGFRIGYENWSWATRASTWQDIWEITKLTGRDNIGLCLDTFHIAATEWADPTTQSGLIEQDGRSDRAALDSRLKKSLEELTASVPPEKIYFYQISDAYKVSPPLAVDDGSGNPPRARWSFEHRPLPFADGYLPVVEITKAVLDTGFTGWLSMEVFDGQERRKYGDDLERVAKDGMKCCQRLIKESSNGGGK
jgi:sugar phosphate isomerase/epimerase